MDFFLQGGSPFFVLKIMYKNIIGQRFGRLKVVSFSHKDKSKKHSFFFCKCDCGNEKVVCSDNLKKGDTKSCGCLQKELTGKRFTTHGMSRSSIYHRWQNMVNRCLKNSDPAYKNYGGRGITVCDRWLKFENFYEDTKKGYKKDLTLDRINNNENYEKSNCCWATRKEQQQNTRRTIKIEYKNQKMCLKDWSKKLGIKYECLWYRLNNGWDIERAFTKK